MEEYFYDLPVFNSQAYKYFAKKNRMSLAAKCFNSYYTGYYFNNISYIKEALNLGISHKELIEAGVYNRVDICKLYELYEFIKNKELEELILSISQERIFKLYIEKLKGKAKTKLDLKILEKIYNTETPKKLVLNLSVYDLCWCIDRIQLSKNVTKAYEFYNELISINKPGRVDTHILNNRLIDTIFENDTGKYTYMLLLCHKDKLSDEDVKRFEEKLDNCDDKQYKYFYLFHTKKDEVLKKFKNYTEFVVFLAYELSDADVFSDEEECSLICEELEKEINKEVEHNRTKYKDALDAISVSNQMHLKK